MYSELYTAVSGMAARQRQMDALTYNLANVNTVAFKVEEMLLGERLLSTPAGTGAAPSHVEILNRWIDFSPGGMEHTGRPLDAALDGEGFFVVLGPGGTRLTRVGQFETDGEGKLTLGGMAVQGTGGDILLGDGPSRITEDGTVLSGGAEVGRLRVVTVESPQQLTREGAGLFDPAGAELEDVSRPRILPGNLELSNASAIRLMIQMIDVVRSFEVHQKMLQNLDRLGEKAVQMLGRT